eukprot:7190954-Lingulodinium_polyedra.AAC.1
MAQGAEGAARNQLASFLAQLCQRLQVPRTSLPLWRLLVELAGQPALRWLFKGLAVGTSILLEKLFFEREQETNPV